MSTTSNMAAPQDSTGGSILGRLAAAPRRWWGAVATWRRQQASIDHLNLMSERELKDIGLSRGDIEFAVRGDHPRNRVFRYY